MPSPGLPKPKGSRAPAPCSVWIRQSTHGAEGVARDKELLIGRNHHDSNTAGPSRDFSLFTHHGRVASLIDFNSHFAHPLARQGSDGGRIFADSAGENQSIHVPQRRAVGSNVFLDS